MAKNVTSIKKLNPTAVLTITLLALMLVGGSLSGIWGFALGREALKGVSQPDARPTAKKNPKDSQLTSKPLNFLKEADIIKTVKTRLQDKGKDVKPEKKEADNNANEKSAAKAEAAEKPPSQPGFPISAKDKGVVLEIRSARQQEGFLRLDVSLKNESSQPVQFVYTFLDITDNWGRPLSANTEGLPGELPANSQAFTGTVNVPNSVLENAEQLSLTLTDYPEQKVRLQASGIPIAKSSN
ncbi:hypothetical protein NIES2119_18545 [[Phormidium ambiguum] IAM M-71]|uniref:DUF4352 domain-containing protein n=1 Tax=[Phormidium ambiguum] IAM M-71 TaxID=454136 RepID=A0A1U7IG90_9CYAN|nr:hypothetical protein [Phormidium ambiguum]OKH35999.1 hypothetical protein NIES2119_18545 [Phormidium ambiguum IAM M-71]